VENGAPTPFTTAPAATTTTTNIYHPSGSVSTKPGQLHKTDVGEIKTYVGEVRSEVDTFRAEVKQDFSDVRSMIKLSYAEIDTRIGTLEHELAALKARVEDVEAAIR
jgi:uncharacterized small protein (DUF1192 family)